MGGYLNNIIAVLILIIITAVCSNFFYKKGQKNTWELSKQLIPLEKNELYVAVEKTDANGVSFLSVQQLSKAVKDKDLDQRELRFRMNIARDGVSLQEYNDKYRGGKKGM